MSNNLHDKKRRIEEAIKKAVEDFRYEDLVHYMAMDRKEVNDLLDDIEITVKVNWGHRA